MIKVVIVDDEERICRLIEALVDWDGLGLTPVGTAHNGLDAVSLIKAVQPDILITDIRMPGCSGLDLIRSAREACRDLEIIVISGFAHFEYAQQAIKYGVGDYLLKPISKAELTATLEKLKSRICQRRESEQDKQELMLMAEKDASRQKENLIDAFLGQEDTIYTLSQLRDSYYLQVRPGLFQAFWLKLDCDPQGFAEDSRAVLMEKVQQELKRSLKPRCFELISVVRGFSCIGLMNYAQEHCEEIRKLLKSCLNRLELQKGLFQDVTFSAAAGDAVERAESLAFSMKQASLLIEERLVKGTGRLLERLSPPSGFDEARILEKYLRELERAMEIMSPEQIDDAADLLEEEARQIRELHGYELLELVQAAADIFAVRIHMVERRERLEQFQIRCGFCSSAEALFACLRSFQKEYIQEEQDRRESDAVRPIRKAKQYIQKHYRDPVTLEEVSGIAGLTPAYFSSLFKKTEGEGFARYLIRVRIEEAKVLLRETNFPVSEVCRRVGYSDLKHFSQTFEKTAGVKPAVYRKLYG